jgi:hypothetical protein
MDKNQLVETINQLIEKLNKLLTQVTRADSTEIRDQWGQVMRLDASDAWPSLVGRAANCAKCGSRNTGHADAVEEVDPVLLAYTNMVESNRANRFDSPKLSDSRLDADDDCDDPVTNAYHRMVESNRANKF